jgi:hypothetical protein
LRRVNEQRHVVWQFWLGVERVAHQRKSIVRVDE